jgi:hypothetical protein
VDDCHIDRLRLQSKGYSGRVPIERHPSVSTISPRARTVRGDRVGLRMPVTNDCAIARDDKRIAHPRDAPSCARIASAGR